MVKGRSCARRSALRLSVGLIVSQMLTLYTTPVVYLYMDRIRVRWEGRKGRRRWGGGVLRFFACAALVGRVPRALAFPCIVSGLLALPLCGAALTFLCRRKEK